jgi:hypothetical protein
MKPHEKKVYNKSEKEEKKTKGDKKPNQEKEKRQ